MQKATIRNGSFTAAGNLTGRTAEGRIIHLPSTMVKSLGFSEGSVKYPIFVLWEESEIFPMINGVNQTDEQRASRVNVAKRNTALSAYIKKEEMFDASNDSKLLEVESVKHYNESLKELGITENDLAALANASI